jgi:hypothetical protein
MRMEKRGERGVNFFSKLRKRKRKNKIEGEEDLKYFRKKACLCL